MRLFDNPKVFLSIGPIQITWYALCILTGAFVAYALSQKTVKKWGYGSALLEDYFIPLFAIGILGARIYYVLFEWEYYGAHPEEILQIWHGGLAIHGGLLAGIGFSVVYFRGKKVSFFRMFDAIMPNVLIAQAFGRWGNFFNQEAYGQIVKESFFQGYPSFIKERMYIDGAYRQPTFLFESAMNVLGFLLITQLFRRFLYKKRGDCGWAYLIWYGLVRFVIEGMRSDSLMIGPFKMAQIMSLVFVGIGLAGLLGYWIPYRKPVVCLACQTNDATLQKIIRDKGLACVAVAADADETTVIQAVDGCGRGHDDCIFISDVIKEIETGRALGLYTVLLSPESQPACFACRVCTKEQIPALIKEERTWSDNTIW